MKTLVGNFDVRTEDQLMAVNDRQDLGLPVERLPYGYFAVGEYIQRRTLNVLQLMKEDIYYENCVGISARTWYLLELFNDLILRIAQSGIQRYWLMDIVNRHMDSTVQVGLQTGNLHHQNVNRPITMPHLVGVFYLLVFGWIVAGLVFAGELLWSRYKQLPSY